MIAENGESGSFIWENSYDAETGINTYYLTLFIKEPDGRYGKSCEEHIQRAYTEEHIKRLIEEAGMEYIASYDDYSFDPAKEDSERVLIVAKEKGK